MPIKLLLDVEEAYQTLGISFDSDKDELREAYRRLAKSAHPDKQGSDSSMVRINAARDLIKDYLAHPQDYIAAVSLDDINKNDLGEIMRAVRINQFIMATVKSKMVA